MLYLPQSCIAGPDYDDLCTRVNVISKPLAGKKLAKKLFKGVGKAAKGKTLFRGVKEVGKALRKGKKGYVPRCAFLCVTALGQWRDGQAGKRQDLYVSATSRVCAACCVCGRVSTTLDCTRPPTVKCGYVLLLRCRVHAFDCTRLQVVKCVYVLLLMYMMLHTRSCVQDCHYCGRHLAD